MTKRLRGSRLLAVVGVALLVGACSTPGATSGPTGSAAAATPAPSFDPDARACKLLTQAEAEAAFGQTFQPPAGTQDGDKGSCRYFNSNGFGLQIDLSTAATVEADFDADQDSFGANAKDLAGVGDKAFEYLQGIRQIDFVKGKTMVILYTASRIDPDVFRGLAKTVAERVE